MLRIILNPTEGITVKNMSPEWEEIPKAIGCDFFDVISLRFDDDKDAIYYDFYVDDIGYYKSLNPSVIPTNYPTLVGTVIIAKSNTAGEDIDITLLECSKIFKHIHAYHPDKEDETKTFYYIKGVSR